MRSAEIPLIFREVFVLYLVILQYWGVINGILGRFASIEPQL
jgi:hypothetical protein